MKKPFVAPATLARSVTGNSFKLFGTVVLGITLTVGAVLGLLPILPAAETSAAGPDEGYVVVVFPDERAMVRPISYTAGITRIGALRLASWAVESSGDAVCAIDGVGCPASDCFCADNWWASAGWDSGTEWWDTITWPPPALDDGDIIGFRWSNIAWGPPLFPAASYEAAAEALAWLHTRQATDGGYGGQSSTVESHLAVGANGLTATDWISAGNSLVDYWDRTDNSPNNAANFAAGNAGRAGKLAVAVAGANGNPVDFTTLNLSLGISLTNYYDSTTGAFDASNNNNHMWAMLGWRAIYTDTEPLTSTATAYLITRSNGDGTWSWAPGLPHDSNATALALQALIAGGECVTSTHVTGAIGYLESIQNSDGGFPGDNGWPGSDQSDANSTAYAVQALMAAGENPAGSEWTVNGNTPLDYLLGLQLADGSLAWQDPAAGSNLLATQQAVAALLGRPYPFNIGPPPQCSVTFGHNSWFPIILKGYQE